MIRFGPTEKNGSCAQCQAIARELNEAFAEAYQRTSPAADALYGLIGGTEEDAERADELVASYKYRSIPDSPRVPTRVMEAIRSGYEHLARTGHRVKRLIR